MPLFPSMRMRHWRRDANGNFLNVHGRRRSGGSNGTRFNDVSTLLPDSIEPLVTAEHRNGDPITDCSGGKLQVKTVEPFRQTNVTASACMWQTIVAAFGTHAGRGDATVADAVAKRWHKVPNTLSSSAIGPSTSSHAS